MQSLSLAYSPGATLQPANAVKLDTARGPVAAHPHPVALAAQQAGEAAGGLAGHGYG